MSDAVEAPRRLILLRHGRTGWNRTGRAQGQADVGLDEVGHAQARAAAPAIASLSPVRVWSSDLSRAARTAAYVGDACGLTVELDERLREFSVGKRQGLTWAESVERFPWLADAELPFGERLARVPGAESDTDVLSRIVPALEDCLAALGPGQAGVAVSHGAVLKLAIAGLLGWDARTARTLGVLGNCGWAVVSAPADPARRQLLSYGLALPGEAD